MLDDWVAGGSNIGITAAVMTEDGIWPGAAGQDSAGVDLVPESAMAIASITKTFVAPEVMSLAGQGVVDLDTPVTDYVYLMEWDLASGAALSRSFVPGLRNLTRMTYTEDGRWLAISHPRSVTVLDPQKLRVPVADMLLPTEAPTDTFADAFAVAAGQDHQLLVGTGSMLASIEMDPEQWKSAACQVAAHQLTKDEWNRFLPEIPYSPACR